MDIEALNLSIYIAIVLFVMGVSISCLIMDIRNEAICFNKGVCLNCGGTYELDAVDGTGFRWYECNKCRTIIGISHRSVDRGYEK